MLHNFAICKLLIAQVVPVACCRIFCQLQIHRLPDDIRDINTLFLKQNKLFMWQCGAYIFINLAALNVFDYSYTYSYGGSDKSTLHPFWLKPLSRSCSNPSYAVFSINRTSCQRALLCACQCRHRRSLRFMSAQTQQPA